MNAQHPQNSNIQQVRTFSKQAVLNHVPRNLEEERRALGRQLGTQRTQVARRSQAR